MDESAEEVEGCRICGKDDDHGNLLICEFCGDEYHTYCLSPPLEEIPEGDWFCGESTNYPGGGQHHSVQS